MANIKKLKANGQDIVPITHEQAVLDSNGVTLDSKLNAINNAISRLENNSTPSTPDTPSTPSLEGNIKILTIGNYTITYNETDDTLDFIYNGATDDPGTGGTTPDNPGTDNPNIIKPTWIDNTNINYQGVQNTDSSAMATDYIAKEDGYTYTINLTSVSSCKIYFFDSSKTFISRTDNLTVDSSDITINFPETCKYFRVKSDKGTATVSNADTYIVIKKIAISSEPGTGGGTTQEEVIPLSWVVGNISSSGAETVQENSLRSDFASIVSGSTYSFYINATLGDPTGIRIYFFDSNKTYISRTSGYDLGYTTGVDIPIEIPSNAGYMRFKANLDSSTTLDNVSTLITLKRKY